MLSGHYVALVALFFIAAGQEHENPWRDKVLPAVEQARTTGTVAAYRQALDAAWRADDWEVGLELAQEAQEKHPDCPGLHGVLARAFWRAGRIVAAERLAAGIPAQTDDPVGLKALITTHLACGEKRAAAQAAERLATLRPQTGENLFYVMGARMALNRLAGLGKLIRRTQKLTDPANGYPETYVAEQLEGVAEFLDAIGPEPINQLTSYGSASMPVVALINLPGCDVIINGRGPYRAIVDTGGSTTLSLDEAVAAELGLESVAAASVHGVAGKDESGQVLVEELKIGGITCRRVVTRTFGVRQAIAHAADAVIGTGIFADARMTMDFHSGRLTVEPSSARPGPGREVDVRIVSDAKLLAPIPLHGEPAVALLDSGADAFAVAPSRLRRIFPDKKITTVSAFALGVGNEQNPAISLTPGVDFEFAGRKYQNYGGLGLDVLDGLLGPLLGIQSDVLVGMPVLREMKTVTVDFPRCKMWVEWPPTE